ncbi:MAG TPA: hypothetical protein VI612_01410 [Candidatus Nanoarchaeia archaeon]|nr:hypothetical protein [Candidatus Nanoarchaeia archaeon]
MDEPHSEHKKKHKDVQDLWEEIVSREKETGQEEHDETHKDYEEEVLGEEE